MLQRAATSSIQAFYRGAIWYNTIGTGIAVHAPIGTDSALHEMVRYRQRRHQSVQNTDKAVHQLLQKAKYTNWSRQHSTPIGTDSAESHSVPQAEESGIVTKSND